MKLSSFLEIAGSMKKGDRFWVVPFIAPDPSHYVFDTSHHIVNVPYNPIECEVKGIFNGNAKSQTYDLYEINPKTNSIFVMHVEFGYVANDVSKEYLWALKDTLSLNIHYLSDGENIKILGGDGYNNKFFTFEEAQEYFYRVCNAENTILVKNMEMLTANEKRILADLEARQEELKHIQEEISYKKDIINEHLQHWKKTTKDIFDDPIQDCKQRLLNMCIQKDTRVLKENVPTSLQEFAVKYAKDESTVKLLELLYRIIKKYDSIINFDVYQHLVYYEDLSEEDQKLFDIIYFYVKENFDSVMI